MRHLILVNFEFERKKNHINQRVFEIRFKPYFFVCVLFSAQNSVSF